MDLDENRKQKALFTKHVLLQNLIECKVINAVSAVYRSQEFLELQSMFKTYSLAIWETY